METVVILGFALGAYFMPTIVAVSRGHSQAFAIGLLNTLLGWTILGWVVAIVWAATNPQPRTVIIERHMVKDDSRSTQ